MLNMELQCFDSAKMRYTAFENIVTNILMKTEICFGSDFSNMFWYIGAFID